MWSAQSDIAASSLTQALATSLGINPCARKSLKKSGESWEQGPITSYPLS